MKEIKYIIPKNNHPDCVCKICGCKFDKQPINSDQLWAYTCPDCGNYLCPNCQSHEVYDILDQVIVVPESFATQVRASVWGRGH